MGIKSFYDHCIKNNYTYDQTIDYFYERGQYEHSVYSEYTYLDGYFSDVDCTMVTVPNGAVYIWSSYIRFVIHDDMYCIWK